MSNLKNMPGICVSGMEWDWVVAAYWLVRIVEEEEERGRELGVEEEEEEEEEEKGLRV